MTVETSEAVLEQLIRFLLADRGVEVGAVKVSKVECQSCTTNWTVECTDCGTADRIRVNMVMRNMMPGLYRKYRLR